MAPVRICVIGGGPSGMSFCHAVESMENQASSEGRKLDDIQVSCFERSSKPGGIWKAADPTSENEFMNMYDELWTNGPSQNMEFPDYTFDEHFGRPVTVYMPRQEVLGYLVGRVTKKCPNFFEKYISFEREIKNVSFDDKTQKFTVVIRNVQDDSFEQRDFEKVIWACGDNGKPRIPANMREIFKGFKGVTRHSCETGTLKQDVKGKRILLVGGGYSAEDLALQAIKLGVEKVYIVSRCAAHHTDGLATKCWPYDKVEILECQTVSSLSSDGATIEFKKSTWDYDGYHVEDDIIETRLENIDTVIFCTGYHPNYDMLNEELRPYVGKKGPGVVIPTDWKMGENAGTKLVGDVAPAKHVFYGLDTTRPDIVHGLMLSNPNMMFVGVFGSSYPLLAGDVAAWLLAAYCTGSREVPSQPELKKVHSELALKEFNLPFFRYFADVEYWKAIDKKITDDAWEEMEAESESFKVALLSYHMRLGNYPMELGDFDELNEQGECLLWFDELSYNHRKKITKEVINKKPWKTFRDYSSCKKFYSIITESAPVTLPSKWLEMTTEDGAHMEEKKSD